MAHPLHHPSREPLPASTLAAEAAELRAEIIDALYASGGGHYGGALSVLDLTLTLYRRVLRIFSDAPQHPDRDRFILSKGHSAIALYAVLRRLGYFNYPLSSYGRVGSPLEGHPDMTRLPGIDFSTGSLGQGLSVGLGMALALQRPGPRVWVVLGDGECQEGQVWEAAMIASRYRIEHLHAVVDANRYQEWGWHGSVDVAPDPVENLALKWHSFGWRVIEVDGHDYEALTAGFEESLGMRGRPSVVIARTVKGKGYPLIESDPTRFHCTSVSESEQRELTKER